jgi:hypothetical protein
MMRDNSGFPSGSRGSLTPGARIIRGFRRIGTVVAIPILLSGIGVSLYVGYDTYTSKERKSVQANCLLSKAQGGKTLPALSYDTSKVDPQAAGCDGPLYSVYPWEIAAYVGKPSFVEDFAPVGVWGSAASIAGAALAYVFFWAIGWIFAGFTRD